MHFFFSEKIHVLNTLLSREALPTSTMHTPRSPVAFSPAAISRRDVQCNIRREATVRVTNTSGAPLLCSFTPGKLGRYTISPSEVDLAPGAQATLTVRIMIESRCRLDPGRRSRRRESTAVPLFSTVRAGAAARAAAGRTAGRTAVADRMAAWEPLAAVVASPVATAAERHSRTARRTCLKSP